MGDSDPISRLSTPPKSQITREKSDERGKRTFFSRNVNKSVRLDWWSVVLLTHFSGIEALWGSIWHFGPKVYTESAKDASCSYGVIFVCFKFMALILWKVKSCKWWCGKALKPRISKRVWGQIEPHNVTFSGKMCTHSKASTLRMECIIFNDWKAAHSHTGDTDKHRHGVTESHGGSLQRRSIEIGTFVSTATLLQKRQASGINVNKYHHAIRLDPRCWTRITGTEIWQRNTKETHPYGIKSLCNPFP